MASCTDCPGTLFIRCALLHPNLWLGMQWFLNLMPTLTSNIGFCITPATVTVVTVLDTPCLLVAWYPILGRTLSPPWLFWTNISAGWRLTLMNASWLLKVQERNESMRWQISPLYPFVWPGGYAPTKLSLWHGLTWFDMIWHGLTWFDMDVVEPCHGPTVGLPRACGVVRYHLGPETRSSWTANFIF
jgi:hypothetical protein